ncbi:Cytochrome P450 [Acorus gramineus]|uniref:Cytochrome P450 n=1 Tax=Acorus gramineus TaxID=55184 RepID=A0AAV9BXB3_ACOGR|nr:Cytochrome P450 [Acorus gramineus]
MDGATNSNTQTPFLVATIAVIVVVLFKWLYPKRKPSRPHWEKPIPPGSFGLPIFGELLGWIRALEGGAGYKWIEERVGWYGPVFKTSFMGTKMVFVTGQVSNKFVFTSPDDMLQSHQPVPIVHMTGEQSIFEVHGGRHKLVRGAILGFVRGEGLNRIVPLMSSLVKKYLMKEVEGKESVLGVILMKKIALKVTCAVLFSLKNEEEIEALFDDFLLVLKGAWTLPIYLPFTTYYRAIAARRRVYDRFCVIIDRKRRQLEDGSLSPHDDLIATMLSLRDEEGRAIPTREIVDNLITIVIASHGSSVSLNASFVRHLAMDKVTLERICEEHTKIIDETKDETLTWSDIQKMKYTWKVQWVTLTHMDETAFPEPEKFDPSRFEGASKSFPPYMYVPFGGGQRVCPGNDYARVSLSLIVHHLVTNFRWSMLIPNEPIVRIPFADPAMNLPIKIYRRGKEEA